MNTKHANTDRNNARRGSPTSLLAAAILMASSSAAFSAGLTNYAEDVYSTFSNASHGETTFTVRSVSSGPAKSFAGIPFTRVLREPTQVLISDYNGYEFQNLRYEDRKAVPTAEMDFTIETMARNGFPLNDGVYRFLEISQTFQGQKSTHDALELCWPEQYRCLVLDPSISFLDSNIGNHKRLRAEGLAPTITSGPAQESSEKAGRCGLSSDPNKLWIKRAYPEYNWRTTIAGTTAASGKIGRVELVNACSASCKAAPSASAAVSFGSGGFLYAVHCDNEAGRGTDGNRQGKAVGYTGCSYAFSGPKFDVKIKNYGTINVDASIEIKGTGNYSNGNKFPDTCYYR